jgi:hypothetical protein
LRLNITLLIKRPWHTMVRQLGPLYLSLVYSSSHQVLCRSPPQKDVHCLSRPPAKSTETAENFRVGFAKEPRTLEYIAERQTTRCRCSAIGQFTHIASRDTPRKPQIPMATISRPDATISVYWRAHSSCRVSSVECRVTKCWAGYTSTVRTQLVIFR